MHLLKTSLYGNPNIGLYGYCTDEYCLLGREVPFEKAQQIGQALGVPVHQMSICGTSLLGVFMAGNSRKLLVPEIAFENELDALEHFGIEYEVIKTHLTALGNNLLCNDTGCLANHEFSLDQRTAISKALGVELKIGKIAGLDTVGSLCAINSKAGMVSRDISKPELRFAEDLLGIKLTASTVNMGSQHIRSGLMCNDNGFVIGDASGGPEIVYAEDELGFLEKENTLKKARKTKR